MRIGYPKRITLQKFIENCESIEKKLKVSDTKYFYSRVLMWLGFSEQDFKIGEDTFFLRLDKFPLLEKKFSDMKQAGKMNPSDPERKRPK